jgi:hypothetical protein
MSLELIAVAGMTVIVDPTSPVPPGAVVATIAVNPPTGTKCKAEGKLVHRDGDQISVSAITVPSAGATIPDPGPYVVALNKSVIKTKAEGKEVLVLNDISATINAIPQIPAPPAPPIPYPVAFNCIISVAGQTKAKAQ